VDRPRGSGLFPLLPARGEARRDLEAAALESLARDRDRDAVRRARRVARRRAFDLEPAAGRVHGIVQVADVTRLVAESARDVWIRSFLERGRDERKRDQETGDQD